VCSSDLAADWLSYFNRFWDEKLAGLKATIEKNEQEKTIK